MIDRDRVTAAGVTSGIDGALALAELLHGRELAERIQLGMEYQPEPPTRAGSPHTAPPGLLSDMRAAGSKLYEARREACEAAAVRLSNL